MFTRKDEKIAEVELSQDEELGTYPFLRKDSRLIVISKLYCHMIQVPDNAKTMGYEDYPVVTVTGKMGKILKSFMLKVSKSELKEFSFKVASYFIGFDILDLLERYKVVVCSMDEAFRKAGPYTGAFEDSIFQLREMSDKLIAGEIDIETFNDEVDY